MKDYQKLYKELLKQAKPATIEACYRCRNTVDGRAIFPDVCNKCHVDKLLKLIIKDN